MHPEKNDCMKKIFLLTIMAVMPLIMKAATEADSTYTLELRGWVSNDMTFDSRKVIGAVNEQFLFMPLDQDIDAEGNDRNAGFRGKYLALTTRLILDFHSPLYNGGFRLGAQIEADFCASLATVPGLVLRKAYVTMDWQRDYREEKMHHILLAGQTFHPMTSDLLTLTTSINTGSPFSPYSRTPMVKYSAVFPKGMVQAAAIYQYQFASPGPDGNTCEYQYNGGVPALYLGGEYKSKQFRIGGGAQYLLIKPRRFAEEGKVDEWVGSTCGMLYIQATSEHMDFRIKSLAGENMGDMFMISGYGATGYKEDGRSLKYAPLISSATSMTLTAHTNNQVHNVYGTLFGGYIKNFGAREDLLPDMCYTRWANNIDQMFRTSLGVQYRFHELTVGVEYEYTGVLYGELQSNGSVANDHLIGNHRGYLTVLYNFSHLWKFKKK